MTSTERKWSERVRGWRESGEGAREYADGKGFAPSTLRFWASRLGSVKATPQIVELVRRAQVPSIEPIAELVVEVGRCRVRVARGFDRELLAEVVESLAGGAQ